MADTRSKAELLKELRTSGREVAERLGALAAEEYERGRYESGWNGRQILAHTAAIEWTYPRLLDIAKGGMPPSGGTTEMRRTEPDKESKVPTRTAEGGIDSYNERQVAKRADATIEELLKELKTNREATIAAVEAADEELFGREIRSAGGITGVLADVIHAVAVVHVRGHVNDIVGTE